MKLDNRLYKNTVVEILSKAFDDNQSINFIVKQDEKRQRRIRQLMSYCFEICLVKGRILVAEDNKSCALLLSPESKIGLLKSIILDLRLAFQCIGFWRILKVLKREKMLKANHPKGKFYYLWFIGVDPESQGKGHGSKILEELLLECDQERKPIYLETSVIRNLSWYEKYDFKTFNEIDIGYKLYLMLRN